MRTSELDNRGILNMQRQMIQEQDTELADLETTVNSTKVCNRHKKLPSMRTSLATLSCLAYSTSSQFWYCHNQIYGHKVMHSFRLS